MGLLRDSDKEAVKERLEGMTGKVKFVYFTQEFECQFCRETGELLQEVADLTDKIDLEVFNFANDEEEVKKYNIDKIPALVMLDESEKDYGIRFYGIPSGYEFVTVLEDILMLSAGDSGLSEEAKEVLAKLQQDVHFQVFVTPTCPYCPNMVKLAHQMAFESEKVRGDMIEASEFPHLSMKYQVQGVPRTVMNEEHSLEGMVPVDMVLEEIQKIG
ncbi:glutaredoxin [bacterium]|nr:glutaredoxin [bacterium]